MPRVGFEPTISAGERPQTYALDRATTGDRPAVILRYFALYKGKNVHDKWLIN